MVKAEVNNEEVAKLLRDFDADVTACGSSQAVRNAELAYGVMVGVTVAETWVAMTSLQQKLARLGDMVAPLA